MGPRAIRSFLIFSRSSMTGWWQDFIPNSSRMARCADFVRLHILPWGIGVGVGIVFTVVVAVAAGVGRTMGLSGAWVTGGSRTAGPGEHPTMIRARVQTAANRPAPALTWRPQPLWIVSASC